jgi:pilus assembly protein CpaF
MSTVDQRLVERVRGVLAVGSGPPTASQVASVLRAEGAVLGDAAVLDAATRLQAEISGAGPLESLLRQPGVTDVIVNGPDEVWVDRGDGLEREAVHLGDESAVRRLAQRLAATADRRLDDAVPYCDARLPGGVRLHAVLPPIAPEGTLISLRVPAAGSMTMADLVARGSVPDELAPWLVAMIRSRVAFLVTGGTGTGKTTVLATMLGLAEPAERIVLVEDSAELRPAMPHVVRLEARLPNVEGAGRVGLDELVRQALRMRPDRLVVGEVRGREVTDLLSALNTGHEGGCGTLHANSAADVPARLEALGVSAGLGRDAVHAQVAAGLAAVVHLVRGVGGLRRVGEIGVVARQPAGLVEISAALRVDESGDLDPGPGLDRLTALVAPGWP